MLSSRTGVNTRLAGLIGVAGAPANSATSTPVVTPTQMRTRSGPVSRVSTTSSGSWSHVVG